MTHSTVTSHQPLDRAPRRSGRGRDLVAVNIGNALEWFDWNIYAIFAPFFAAQFFRAENPVSSLLSTLAVFAVGFLMRPVGGWLFGRLADEKGRKFSLTLAILLASAGSLLIAVAPTFDAVGVFAGVVLLVARLVQGLSHGGETGSAFTYLAEIAPRDRRGVWASTPWLGVGVGTMLATGIGVLLTALLTEEQMAGFGWRIPFAVAAVLGLYALYIRKTMNESEVHTERKAQDTAQHGERRRSLREVVGELGREWRPLLQIIGLTISGVVAFYTWFIFAPGYASREFGMDPNASLVAGLCGQAVFLVAIPVMGWLSDRFGRRPVLLVFAAGFALLAFPLEWMLGPSPVLLFLAMAAGSVLLAANCAPLGAVFAELVPTRLRATLIGIGYATSGAIFGGTAPYLNTWLSSIGMHGVFVGYMIALCLISVVVIIRMPETARGELR
ncbi:MFS transporter [Micrococcus sp. TA1]|uniref:MFS transporter n=1 Tax=Micrococcus sp. TA1 TaxID=681627 RepID=UPI0016115834|nr:MFS transporter [Micrococcus sp. TA1]MBB5749969.1 MHS family alpha-ketoglutarate permease-like MFS transporter [Micrococcus sp. TA1]